MKKKFLSLACAAALCTVFLTSCTVKITTDSKQSSDVSKTMSNSEAASITSASTADNEEYTVDFCKGFKISYLNDGIKLVTDGENRELILVPKSLGMIPQEYAEKNVILTPVENAVFLSSTQISMLAAADKDSVWDSIGGLSVNTDYSEIPAIKQRIDSGSIKNVGVDSNAPDYEVISSLKPEIVFVSTGSFPQTDVIAKLEELKIPYAVDNEYMENDYLARMEWMRFVLSFYNEDALADKEMKSAVKTINDVKAKIADVEKVKIAQFSVYGGEAYVTSNFTWVGSMVADLGITNVFGDVSEYSLSLEELFVAAKEADILIYGDTPTYTNGIEAIVSAFPQIVECKAYQNGNVYQYTDKFWMGIQDTDEIAADLAAVAHPTIFSDRELSFYLKIK